MNDREETQHIPPAKAVGPFTPGEVVYRTSYCIYFYNEQGWLMPMLTTGTEEATTPHKNAKPRMGIYNGNEYFWGLDTNNE